MERAAGGLWWTRSSPVSVESLYFSLGRQDVIIICDGLDQAGIDAICLTIASTDAIDSYQAIPLSTADEIDAAAKKSPAYRAPGA